MSRAASEADQAVSRTLRDSLERLQRITEELHQAVNDVASACASARPSNTLPPLLRAQAQAASLAATLEVLSRFVTATLSVRSIEVEPEPLLTSEAASLVPEPETAEPQRGKTADEPRASEREEPRPPAVEAAAGPVDGIAAAVAAFDVSTLSIEDQELHRRANRVAKVSMQDIKLLRPDEVKLGKEHKDLCLRLRDDIEKAHKEYDRRFQTILGHPVDYFYNWMVEILGEGDPESLGDYPYPSPVLRR